KLRVIEVPVCKPLITSKDFLHFGRFFYFFTASQQQRAHELHQRIESDSVQQHGLAQIREDGLAHIVYKAQSRNPSAITSLTTSTKVKPLVGLATPRTSSIATTRPS